MPELTVRDRVLNTIKKYFGDDGVLMEKIEAGEEIFGQHGLRNWHSDKLDSLDREELVMAIEDEFCIEIPDSVSPGFKTFNDLVEYVEKMTAGPAHGAH